MLQMEEYVNIRDYTTFKVGGQFRYFTEINDVQDLPELYRFAENKKLTVHLLGGGSNMVFPDGVYESVVAKIHIAGFEVIANTSHHTDIRIGAGENWDSVVERVVEMNLSGIEALSAIPGTCGATPVQNVGAYGQEIKDTLHEVEVFDTQKYTTRILTNEECSFSYRDSIFKKDPKGKYVIIAIVLRLSKDGPTIPNYPGVKKYFLENGINNPTLRQIREAIIEIRKNKLPNPDEISNAGSFFKNPIVLKDVARRLKELHPEVTVFPVDENHTKIPAGFLIEASGLKGKNFGPLSVYEYNALVLVNNGSATRADVTRVANEIRTIVFEKFGITLETEPEFV